MTGKDHKCEAFPPGKKQQSHMIYKQPSAHLYCLHLRYSARWTRSELVEEVSLLQQKLLEGPLAPLYEILGEQCGDRGGSCGQVVQCREEMNCSKQFI